MNIDLKSQANNCDNKEYIDNFSYKEAEKEWKSLFDSVLIDIIIDEYENTELVKAILALTRNERIVIILNFVEGMTPKEISDIMDIRTNNAYVHKNQALKKLRAKLTQ